MVSIQTSGCVLYFILKFTVFEFTEQFVAEYRVHIIYIGNGNILIKFSPVWTISLTRALLDAKFGALNHKPYFIFT